jgi:hypothetical protein
MRLASVYVLRNAIVVVANAGIRADSAHSARLRELGREAIDHMRRLCAPGVPASVSRYVGGAPFARAEAVNQAPNVALQVTGAMWTRWVEGPGDLPTQVGS